MSGTGAGGREEISGALLTRNWALNLLGWVVPLSLAFVAIPYVVGGLGAERFGVLSIASALLGYFGIFDLGLGRATTKFVAEALARGDTERLPKVVWTSLWSQALFGTVGTAATLGLIPVLVDHFLKLSPGLVQETRNALFVLSASLCVVLTGNAFRGVLEAGQRFDVVNYVKVPVNTSMFLLPAVGVYVHLRLPGIVWLLVAARVAATMAYFVACLRLFPALRGNCRPDPSLYRPMLVYGGWVTVSNFVAPLLAYVDRFLIGSLVSMSAVGYYSAPYEAINRAWVVPGTLAATLFPAFTTLDAGGSKQRLEELCARSIKSLLLLSTPVLLGLVVFARQLLGWWLGPDFADQSTLALQILAVGMLISSVALVPFSLLQGTGRPDLTGKFNLLEFVFHGGSCWFLVKHFGISGAALAWALRSLLDAILMFSAVFYLETVSFRSLLGHGLRKTLLAVSGLAGSLVLVWGMGGPVRVQGLVDLGLVLVFVGISWAYVLDHRERNLLSRTATQVRFVFARPQ